MRNVEEVNFSPKMPIFFKNVQKIDFWSKMSEMSILGEKRPKCPFSAQNVDMQCFSKILKESFFGQQCLIRRLLVKM